MNAYSTRASGRTTLLLTGFGPFPGTPANATGHLVPALAARARLAFPDAFVAAEILPTEWATAPARLDALVAELAPDVTLHFGVSHRARGFELEQVGRNVRADMADACGARPGAACVAADGPATLPATLPVGAIAARLRQLGIPAFVSRDAGTYLCNALLYHTLRSAQTGGHGGRRGFIHIPTVLADTRAASSKGNSPLDWAAAERGGLEIIAMALGRAVPRHATVPRPRERMVLLR